LLPAKGPEGHAHERYDILQWIVSFKLFGKGFDLEGWEPVYAKIIVPAPDSDSIVIQVAVGAKDHQDVTQDAKEAMDTALSYMASKPAAFFSCKQAVIAVTKILGKDLLPYTMPQSLGELEKFDWDNVVIGDRGTYPEAPPPDDADFAVVKAVHKLSKDEKDAAAIRIGMQHSGVPSYVTYLQKWKQWRDIHAIYQTMFPKETIQTTHDRVVVSLKGCRAVAGMLTAIDEDIKKFLAARKRAKKKKAQLSIDMAAKDAEAKEAEKKAVELAAEKATQEREKAQTALEGIAAAGVGERVTRRTTEANRKEKEDELKRKEAAICETQQKIQEADNEAKRKLMEKQRLQEQRQKIEDAEAKARNAKKKSKRNDVTRLDMDPTPRKKS
jgi:hypothetical protein